VTAETIGVKIVEVNISFLDIKESYQKCIRMIQGVNAEGVKKYLVSLSLGLRGVGNYSTALNALNLLVTHTI